MVDEIEHVFVSWHDCAKNQKLDDLAGLYDVNAVFESPLVPAILGCESGVILGRSEIRRFFGRGAELSSDSPINWYRSDEFFSNGRTLIWEYPRKTPSGEQFDVVEVMEIEGGKIVKHRVYCGWFSSKALFSQSE